MLRHYKKAFTLIELITVISIIGLLSAIAVSSMKSSNDKAKLAASQSFEASIGRVVGDQIIGEWLFDEGSGTTARDTSGNGNDGTISGATWTSGINGNALSFINGSSQVALGAGTALDPSVFTITAWVKPADISGGYNYIYSNARDCCGSYSGINFYFAYNHLGGDIWNIAGGWPGGVKQLGSVAVIPNNSPWVFVVFSYDGSKMALYVNGHLDNTLTTNMAVGQPASYPSYIGRMGMTPLGINGAIDQVRLYSNAIIAANIEKMYLAERDRYLAKK